MKKESSIRPSILVRVLFTPLLKKVLFEINQKIRAASKANGISFQTVDFCTVRGTISPANPRINTILNILKIYKIKMDLLLG